MATVYGFAIYGSDLLTRLGAPGGNRGILVALFLLDTLLAAGVAFFDMGVSAKTALITSRSRSRSSSSCRESVRVRNGTIFDTHQLKLTGVKPGGILVGTVLAIFAFVGFEKRQARWAWNSKAFRNIPRAILWSCLIVGLFYVVVSYSQIYGFTECQGRHPGEHRPAARPGHAHRDQPRLHPRHRDRLQHVRLHAGLHKHQGSRLIFSMARDGMGPSPVGSVHRARSTPHIAIAVAAVPMIVVPVVTTIMNQSAVNASGWVGTVATFGFMLGYALVGIGAPIFLRRAGVPAALAWVLGLLGAAIMVFVFWANWLPQTIPGHVFPLAHGTPGCPTSSWPGPRSASSTTRSGSGAIPGRRLRSGTTTTRQKKKRSPWRRCRRPAREPGGRLRSWSTRAAASSPSGPRS